MNRKRSTRALVILAAITVIAALVALGQPNPVVWAQEKTPTPEPPKLTAELRKEVIPSLALEGNLLGDPAERRIYVVLPPGYASEDKRYPVVYVMPWGDEQTANAYGFKLTMEKLLRKGEIGEMIFVVPYGTNSLGSSQFRSSVTMGDYEAFVTRDLVEYMDTHYRTLPSRDSRALTGCHSGGVASVRLGLKYPEIFSVVAATDARLDDSLEAWPRDALMVKTLTKLPEKISDLRGNSFIAWYIQAAAGVAPDPNNPPFYCEMPVRIVDGHGEFVPEVIAKIVNDDAIHRARRYAEQAVRLRGIFISRSLHDPDYEKPMHNFVQALTELGIEYDYEEVDRYHCGYGWEEASLKYIASKLVFEE